MSNSLLEPVVDPVLGDIEVGFMVGTHEIDARTFAVYLPKLMPMIEFSDTRERSKAPINKSIFVNEESTRPDLSSTVTVQNFITAILYPNRTTDHSSNRDVKNKRIGPGNRMILNFFDGNITARRINEIM